MRIEMFGNLKILSNGLPVSAVNTNRLQSLLAYLLLEGEAPHPREKLAGVLWPDSSESQARTNLRQLLHHLRRALPPDCCFLEADTNSVRWLRSGNCQTDTADFESAVLRGDDVAAVSLYQEDLLSGLYDDWLKPHREHYRREAQLCLSRLLKGSEASGDFAAAITFAERLISFDPLSETSYQALIRLYAVAGDRASALRAYHQCMRTLRREMGVDPGAATRELFEQTLRETGTAGKLASSPPSGVLSSQVMVGRQHERAQLESCWNGMARGGSGVAILLGEPGIGKSRLAEEFRFWCASRGASVAWGRCFAAQGQLAYAPVAEWLRSEPLRRVRAQLPQAQLIELARLLPEILAERDGLARPQPLQESWQRHHFYEAIHGAFARAAKPLLLVIDDLQWCDAGTFDWLLAFLRSSASDRVMVAATVRPEETGRDHPFTGLLAELRKTGTLLELNLQPLDTDEVESLARQTANRVMEPSELAGLQKSSRGNPLFVVESLRAGLQGSSPKIQAVIASRFAQLSRQAYELAGLAGAVGQAFSFELLEKATDWDEASLSNALDELWQRRIIEASGTSGYDFTHDRLREVALTELSPVRARFWHRRIARALVELYGAGESSVNGRMAAHYEAAGMAEEAITQYRSAAVVARGRYADAEAASQLRRAISLCRELPESRNRELLELELLVELGPVLVTTSGYAADEVGETYQRAEDLLHLPGALRHLTTILSGSWVFHEVRGHFETARALSERLVEAGRQEQEGSEAILAGEFLSGSCLFHLGDFTESERLLTLVLENYTGTGSMAIRVFAGPDLGVFCGAYLSHALWHSGKRQAALWRMEASRRSAVAVGHPFSMVIALNYAAMLHVFEADPEKALAAASEASAICMKYGFAYYGSMAEILAGWGEAQAGRLESGIVRLKTGIDSLRATGAEMRLPFYYAMLAEVCLKAGRTGEGLAHVSTAFAFQGKNRETWSVPMLQRVQAAILAPCSSENP